ncbi:MAG: hypothetical protein Terrestrivirus5_40 [Terrestrivirus sp.]|uniref:Uncharacterized protein n=1 Tax=Terrestrivirus sp. TaxID=2487775 RepID=A0A3G4ZMZ4_9VIRU|nr:MAG: hypothetical protein Terrestrivirus5_40 [Terrestrivirus sp.]
MSIRIDIKKDLKSTTNVKYAKADSNATVTFFKTIFAGRPFTHYRKWIETTNHGKDSNTIIVINKDKYNSLNGMMNLLFVIDCDNNNNNNNNNNKLSFEDEIVFNQLSIKLRIGDLVIFDQECYGILNILKSMNELYNKAVSIYENDNQIYIPLQNFMMKNVNFPTCSFKDDLIIEFYYSHYKNVITTCEAYQLDQEEYKRFRDTAHETRIRSYHTELHRIPRTEPIVNIPLESKVLIRNISLLPLKGTVTNAYIDSKPFTKLSDPYNKFYETYSNSIPNNKNKNNNNNKYDCFIYDTVPTNGKDGSTEINTGFIVGNNNRSIIVKFDNSTQKPDELDYIDNYVLITIGYDNILNTKPEIVFDYLPYKYDYSNNYPLTKVSDTEYIEGYWYDDVSDSKETRTYPFPKPEPNKQINEQFMSKLETIIENANSFKHYGMFGYDESKNDEMKEMADGIKIKFTNFMGGSHCRLCEQMIGSDEGIIVKNDIKYRFPSGIIHYYKDHDVQPSEEFNNLIMSIDIDSIIDFAKDQNNKNNQNNLPLFYGDIQPAFGHHIILPDEYE